MRYISDLHEGDQVSEIYLCKTKSPGTSKFGKSYYSLTLQDKTGMIDGKVWELTNAIGHFEAMDYILVRGQVTSYQGSNQLNIQQIRKAQEGEFDMADYMPSTKKDISSSSGANSVVSCSGGMILENTINPMKAATRPGMIGWLNLMPKSTPPEICSR